MRAEMTYVVSLPKALYREASNGEPCHNGSVESLILAKITYFIRSESKPMTVTIWKVHHEEHSRRSARKVLRLVEQG